MTTPRRALPGLLTAAAVLAAVAGCGQDSEGSEDGTLTVYSAQHESLVRTMLEGFTEETGIGLEFRDADDSELANQIVQEGDASPADVFLTENSPAIAVVDAEGLLEPVAPGTLDQVEPAYRPESGNWVGFAARSTALIYNPDEIAEGELPASLLDLADPAWEGRVAIAPGGADFQAIAAAVLALEGEDVTRQWLAGLERNAEIYSSNTAIMKAVDEGAVPVGITYHYYWFRDQAQNGLVGDDARLHWFGNQDPGAFVSVSGAGVLASSDQQDDAQRLVEWLTAREAQERLADSSALEYAVGVEVGSSPDLPPLAGLQAPPVDPGSLDAPLVTELMQEAGLL